MKLFFAGLLSLPLVASAAGFDVNDVNFLFPMTHVDSVPFYPDVKLSAGIIGSDLFGEIIEKFMENTGGGTGGDAFAAPNFTKDEIGFFHVVNFRYDPCFAGSPQHPEQCIQQVRLIVQPYNPNVKILNNGPHGHSGFDQGILVPDYSMHFLFKLGQGLPARGNAALQDMLDLKVLIESSGFAQAGQVLQVSPALSQELAKELAGGQPGPIAAKIKALISKYATSANLDEVTVINGSSEENDSLGTWNYVDGLVQNHHWVIQNLPRYARATTLQTSDTTGLISDDFNQQLPSPRLADPGKKPWAKMSDSEKHQQFQDLENIQNPWLFSPKTMDCASCHLAPIAEIHDLSQGGFAGIATADVLWQPPKGVTGFPDPKLNSLASQKGDGFQNVHAIGYFESSPVVTRMVAHSAAAGAETVNNILGLTPPTDLDCRSFAALVCFLKVDSDAQACLDMCREH